MERRCVGTVETTGQHLLGRQRARYPTTDAAVSTVVATILLVALALVAAMAVYVFADAFATDGNGMDRAGISVKAVDTDGDRKTDWIRLLLVTAPSGPYSPEVVSIHLTDEEGNAFVDEAGVDDDERDPFLCMHTEARAGDHGLTAKCDNSNAGGYKSGWFEHGDAWAAGQVLFVPCQDASGDGSGPHVLTVRIRDAVVLDRSVTCDRSSPVPDGPG